MAQGSRLLSGAGRDLRLEVGGFRQREEMLLGRVGVRQGVGGVHQRSVLCAPCLLGKWRVPCSGGRPQKVSRAPLAVEDDDGIVALVVTGLPFVHSVLFLDVVLVAGIANLAEPDVLIPTCTHGPGTYTNTFHPPSRSSPRPETRAHPRPYGQTSHPLYSKSEK